MKVEILAQGDVDGSTLSAAIKERVREQSFTRIDIAVAYLTMQGVRVLERLVGDNIASSRWMIGLDDAVTQPEALEYLHNRQNVELKVAKLSPLRRFHPKIYSFYDDNHPGRSLLVVGSSNLTERGMIKNAECNVLIDYDSKDEAPEALSVFESFWALGDEISLEGIERYRESYVRAKAKRKELSDSGDAPPEPEANASVAAFVPHETTKEIVLAEAVARIANAQADGVCTLQLAYDRVPRMVALNPVDYTPYKGQTNPRWHQIIRNIKSNDKRKGGDTTNYIANGYLEHVGGGYRITQKGKEHIKNLDAL
ncbi:phospholipase D-like domain-containing protein [Brevundimonas diminuta]|uniref:phospholipase D-like domain-containing protein n=1 Tax=Brevundimonas diminuta TaxID=293 RepID=UPI003D9A1A2D